METRKEKALYFNPSKLKFNPFESNFNPFESKFDPFESKFDPSKFQVFGSGNDRKKTGGGTASAG